MTTPRKQSILSVIGAVAIVALFACGGGGPEASSDPGVFYKGDAGTVRVFPGSQATGDAKETGDRLVQTYSVAANPADVARFYTDSLNEWVPVEPISSSAEAANQYKAAWERGSSRLELLTENPAREAGDNPTIHYTLILQN